MKVGIVMFVTGTSLPIVELARAAESLGFESLWVPEHPVVPETVHTPYPRGGELPDFYRRLLDPFVGLAAAAGATSTLKLGTAICLVPQRDPIITAKEVATLDVVSGGRFQFGVGAGWLREEMQVFGVDVEHRWRQARDHVQAMQKLWAQSPASHEGPYVDFPPVDCDPKPVQKPHPPVFIAGELEHAARRIATYGDGWIPRIMAVDPEGVTAGRRKIEQAMRDKGRDASRLNVTLFGCPTKRDELRRYADAGVDRALHVLYPEEPQQTRERLEKLAEATL